MAARCDCTVTNPLHRQSVSYKTYFYQRVSSEFAALSTGLAGPIRGDCTKSTPTRNQATATLLKVLWQDSCLKWRAHTMKIAFHRCFATDRGYMMWLLTGLSVRA